MENIIYALEGVTEVAVVGIPDEVWGQSIKAYVVVSDKKITEKQILAHCKNNLENYMVPQHIEFRDSLPKTNSGKIKKTDLKG